MTETVIETEGLTRRLAGEVMVTLVEDAALAVHQGEFVAITGASGSGKSSLLYLLGLLDRPTSGRIWLRGDETSTLEEDMLAGRRLAEVGFVFQFHFLLPEFSALENVMLPMQRLGRLQQSEIGARATELLGSLGLAPGHGIIKRPFLSHPDNRYFSVRLRTVSPSRPAGRHGAAHRGGQDWP